VLTGKRRPPIACRNTNWQLVLDEGKLPSYKTLRRFVGTEIALPAASVEGSAISFLDHDTPLQFTRKQFTILNILFSPFN
jgi:hypothetical protein